MPDEMKDTLHRREQPSWYAFPRRSAGVYQLPRTEREVGV